MSRSTSLSSFINLKGGMAADEQIDLTLAAAHTEKLELELKPLLAAVDPATAALAQGVLTALGRVLADVAVLRQSIEQTYRSRADRIRIDPLPFIPQDRRSVAPVQEAQFELYAGDAEFSGTGWHAPETDGVSSWRWSGVEPASTILLPTLGGGRLHLILDMQMPFGLKFTDVAVTALINQTRLDLKAQNPNSSRCNFEADFELPDDEGFSSFALILQGERYRDPREAANPDPRELGVGVHKISMSRREK